MQISKENKEIMKEIRERDRETEREREREMEIMRESGRGNILQ